MSFNTLSNDLSISSHSQKQQFKEKPQTQTQNEDFNEKINDDSNEDTTFEPLMSRKIIKLIAEKYNIPMDDKNLTHVLKTLEKHECKYQKLDKITLKQLRIKQDKLSSFGIQDINKEIINALCNDNYGADNLKSLDDIELFTDYVDTTSYNTPEYQLITFLKWCVIYADFDSYMVAKTNYKSTPNFKFNSTELKEIIQEIKDLGDTTYKKVNILAYDFSGSRIRLDKEKFNMKINWCNRFMENRFTKIINPAYPNSNQYKCWCRFLNDPIKISIHNKKFIKLQQTDYNYHKFLRELYNYHKNIAKFIPNPVVMPHEKCSERSSAFMQSLLSYQYNKTRDIKNIMDENHEDYYMNNDISDRLTCFYKLLSFDLDVNKNTFELPKLKQDLIFIIDYLLKPINNIKIYYTIDFNKIINVDTVLKELDSLIANDSNKTHEHQYRYWVLDQSKDVSIHIYVSGVMFTDMQLFGLSKIILQAVNNYYLFYIDHSTYKAGQQQFRCPFSGKMAAKPPRKPVIRTTTNYTKEDLIEFYQYCTVYPTKNDKYCNKFECFMEHCNDVCIKKRFIKNTNTISTFTATNKKTVRVVNNIESLYELHPVEFDKPTQLLIDMQIETVQKIYGYPEHRPARLTLLHNIIALGGNMANILEVNAKLGINHTNGTHTENLQNKEDCNWIISQYNKNKTSKDKINGQKAYLYYNDKLLYKHGKPIIFPMTRMVKKILFETPLTSDIAKYLTRHYYAFVGAKQVYYYDVHENQITHEPEKVLCGPLSKADQMPTDKLNIYTENGLISINPYNYFASTNVSMHRFNTVGYCNNYDCFNIYPLDIPEIKQHQSFDELFKTYPNFYALLFRIFNCKGLTKEEVNNRISYYLISICYAIQNPDQLKPKALLINTQNSAGKTALMSIIKDCFDKLVLVGKRLQNILSDRFNDYLVNKVIVCCEELKTNQDYELFKQWVDDPKYTVEGKNKDIVTVINTSLKIFHSNNKTFNFIKKKDRRIVIFRSDIVYPTKIDDDIAKLFDQSEYRNKFINYFRDYLINYDTQKFKPSNPDFIPQSCKDQYNDICENNEANENPDVLLIKTVFNTCMIPIFKEDSAKVISGKHIVEIINLIISQVKNFNTYDDFRYDSLESYDKDLFINKECYISLCELVRDRYDLRNPKINWYVAKVTTVTANEQHINKRRYRPSQLDMDKIPDSIKGKYNGSAQINVFEYDGEE